MWQSGGSQTGEAPVGSIVAWAKTLTGTPAIPTGWVECDGSVLSDADSPLDGVTIPDLNGNNNFMRGNSTSGGTGGAATHTLTEAESGLQGHTHTVTDPGHTHSIPRGAGVVTRDSGANNVADTSGGTSGSKTTGVTVDSVAGAAASSAHENLPPYYDVVWIMRVK